MSLADSILYDYGGVDSAVGPSSDGTYGIPFTAQQTNDPSNTAGFPSFTSQDALDLLKYGVASITDTWKFSQMLDYKRFEATNGGVFAQGRPANAVTSSSVKSGNNLMLAGLVLAGVLLLTRFKG